MSTQILNKEGISYGSALTMETIICYKCGIPFAVPANYKSHLHSSQDEFYCPNGHCQHYTKSTETFLREQLEAEKKKRENESTELKARIFDAQQETANWKKQWEKQLSEKKKSERKLKRLNNGVCSCCNRTFQNLAEHIKTKHPELVGKTKQLRKSKTK